MEFTPEFIQEHQLTEDQVKGITPFIQEQFATKQKEWDGKANKNAEGIIDGAIKSIQKQFGVELDRNEGEKAAEYLTRYSSTVVSGKQSELDKLKEDYQTKIKGVKGTEALQAEYDKMKQDREEILQKYADYDEIKERAEKYDEASQTLSTLKREVAYTKERPKFPEGVNGFEADAKWKMFIEEFEEKYVLEIEKGEAFGIDKENEYKKVKLKDLVSKDQNIQGLLKGRQQGGTGAKQVDLKTVEGVPFKVPVNATAKDRAKAIKEHLISKNIDPMSSEYSKMFEDLNKKILQGKNQAA